MTREERLSSGPSDICSINKLDVIRSPICSPTKEKISFNEIKTPNLEDGALRSGGARNLYSSDSIGLLAQYAAVGIIYGAFPRTIYPFLNNYFNMDGYQTVAASTLVLMPWSFKTFIGIVSDSFPIYGYRRKPYMIIGWGLCCIMLIIMACLPVGDPYYRFYQDRDLNDTELKILQETNPSRFNYDAPGMGSKYIVLMMFASIGYVVADVAADGMVVEFAQLEPENIRGTVQTTIYLVRTIFSIFSTILVGFCMNGKDYGGEFTWTLNFNTIMIILALTCIFTIPTTIYLLKEEKNEKIPFMKRIKEMWKIIQQRAIWQIMAFKFFHGIFNNFNASPAAIVQRDWAGVQPLNDSIFSIISLIVFAATLWSMKKWGLNWDWRKTIAFTTIGTVFLDAIPTFLTIFDIVRNQWFWLGVPILGEFPEAIGFIISTYVVVELADEGYEGATYGLITTISNLSHPFSSTIYNNIDANFDAFKEDIKRDDDYARMQVAYTFILAYIVQLLSMGWLILLPRQKKEAQELKRTGGTNYWAGVIALILGAFALIWSVTVSLLSIYQSTSCLKIAGGRGC